MIPFTVAEVAAATNGRIDPPDAGSVVIDGPVVTDSRVAGPGSLYVARIGESADGHRFAPGAAAAGAVATLGLRPVEVTPTVIVEDVQEAFAKLARAVVDKAPQLTIVGVTGSSGKTSTKDLLGQVLASQGETVSPEGSYNSEVGVPLTVCRITEHTRYLVAEMGATHLGNIAYLTQIAPPRIGIVLNVGHAHVGEFGSVETIARTKAELVQSLPADGLAILNADDPRVAAMAKTAPCRVQFVGRGEGADLRARDVHLDPAGRASFTVDADGTSHRVQLAVFGEHQVGNALSVMAAALEVGLPMPQIIQALGHATAVSRWRMEVHTLASGATLINDAYNANPDSMAAALRALQAIGRGKRTTAVLGEMLELGADSTALHEGVGQLAAELGIDRVMTVGDGATPIGDGAARGQHAPQVSHLRDTDTAYSALSSGLGPDDVVLLKSSRDSGLRYLGDRLAGLEVPA